MAGSGTETRQTTITLAGRFTPDEADAVRAAARDRGVGPSSFVRATVLRAAGRPAPGAKRRAAASPALSDADRDLLREVLGELGRVGNNANQIARACNVGEGFDRVAVGRLVADVAALRAAVAALARGPT